MLERARTAAELAGLVCVVVGCWLLLWQLGLIALGGALLMVSAAAGKGGLR